MVFTGSKRLFQLSRPHLRCENEERTKRSAGQNVHVHILLLHSFCSSNYSSLARGRGFGVNMRLQTFFLMFEVAFLLEITMMNFTKKVLKGKKKQVKPNSKSASLIQESKRQEPLHVCAFPVAEWERASFFWLLCSHSTVSHKLHILFIYCSYTNHIFD